VRGVAVPPGPRCSSALQDGEGGCARAGNEAQQGRCAVVGVEAAEERGVSDEAGFSGACRSNFVWPRMETT
jgi:hypothetical protein